MHGVSVACEMLKVEKKLCLQTKLKAPETARANNFFFQTLILLLYSILGMNNIEKAEAIGLIYQFVL